MKGHNFCRQQSPPNLIMGAEPSFRLLLCGFMVSLSFGVTQIPLLYAFRAMSCDEYYAASANKEPDRCAGVPAIDSATAKAISLLAASNTLFGVFNLFLTSWTIKKIGVKRALLIQVFFPAARLLIQNIGVETGRGVGIMIIQCSQITTIVGGPAGYLLALNSFVAEVVVHKEKTGAIGRLQGAGQGGVAIGFLLGGILSDALGVIAPFRISLLLFVFCSLYVAWFLPATEVSNEVTESLKPAPSGLAQFFEPLRIFKPEKWILYGRVNTQYGVSLLGVGVFLGVLATGFVPMLLQLYSADVLGFSATNNSSLIFLNSMLRALFLTFMFPRIISFGRKHTRRWQGKTRGGDNESSDTLDPTADTDTDNTEAVPAPLKFAVPEQTGEMDDVIEPVPVEEEDEKEEVFTFDLTFTTWSLLVDAFFTGLATFITRDWQIYIIAALLPLASGTSSSASGTILMMSSAARSDALSAIALVDMIARLTTVSVFGLVYARLSELQKPNLVFVCNAVS